jgi:disulfide bond formation protein DsbB
MEVIRTATNAVYTMLAVAVLALAVVPVGGAVFVLGFMHGDSPCVMCWEQRIAMALVALIGLFVLRFGAKPKYVGLSVLVGAWGVFMGLRHVGMHAARDIGQGFSAEILGAHTYTWSLLIFWFCIVTMGVLLMMRQRGDTTASPRTLRPLEALTMVVFLVVIAGNIVQAFASTGPPPYMGQGDPVRFSFNPKHWVWSLEEWSNVTSFDRWSLRGRWAAEKPSLAGLIADPHRSPIQALRPVGDVPMLDVKEQRQLALPLKGTITDLAYDQPSDRFLLTTQHGVYIFDGGLQRLVRYTVVDPGYSVDLGDFAGAAFLDSRTVIAVGENKSYVVLREDDQADADRNFRYFLESSDKFSEVRRGRFSTVRARMMYVMSAAFDQAARPQSLYTVTVPNSKSKGMVVSRFQAGDLTLSEEFAVTSATDEAFNAGRSFEEFYVTGAAIENGRMYALSAAYSTLLTIDLASHAVVAVHGIRGLDRPTGIAIKGDLFYIACEDGRIVTVAKPVV